MLLSLGPIPSFYAPATRINSRHYLGVAPKVGVRLDFVGTAADEAAVGERNRLAAANNHVIEVDDMVVAVLVPSCQSIISASVQKRGGRKAVLL